MKKVTFLLRLRRHFLIKFIGAFLLSVGIIAATYFIGNSDIPMPDEMKVLRTFDRIMKFSGQYEDNVPDSILLVNVCYDKQLVDYSVHDIPVGQFVITDREKLLQFLTAACEADNYRYIMMDVFFEHSIKSPQDSALFATISKMNRIVIANHTDSYLSDSLLKQKSAYADYTVTWKEAKFSHFQFMREGDEPTMPLRIYEDLTGKTIKRWGPFYFSDGRLCKNAITLNLPIRVAEDYSLEAPNILEKRYEFLGADILAHDSIYPVSMQLEDKIVIIGDFMTDVHDTYLGPQPGSLICINAYHALQQGDHYFQWGWALVQFLIYFIIGYFLMSNLTFARMVPNLYLRMLFFIFSVPSILLVVALIAYVTTGYVYNMYIPTFLYWLYQFIYNIYMKSKMQIK
ncbi:MAG: CHASE2 domain-containing protein [Bacteroidaceae bacterium]|nr:CHASE2 domain-containing protein [Bacteroidaceae bacterium]